MISSVWKFINYWYFRYLLVTELYMVEKWERAMFHVLFLVIFTLVFLFNNMVTLGLVSWARSLLDDSSAIAPEIMDPILQ